MPFSQAAVSPLRAHALFAAVVAGLVGVLVACAAWAPEPDPVPRRWQLDLRLGPLRMVTLDSPEGSRESFYVLTYRVTNTSGEDLLLAPSFEMSTASGELLRSGRNVPARVTATILELLNNPFIEDQISILGVIMQGEENAKDGVVIWPVTDYHPVELAIYASGFSGETKHVMTKDPGTGEPVRSVVRKTYMSRYLMPGELVGRGTDPFDPYEQKWIMR